MRGHGTLLPGVEQTLRMWELVLIYPMAATWGRDQADARDSRWQTRTRWNDKEADPSSVAGRTF